MLRSLDVKRRSISKLNFPNRGGTKPWILNYCRCDSGSVYWRIEIHSDEREDPLKWCHECGLLLPTDRLSELWWGWVNTELPVIHIYALPYPYICIIALHMHIHMSPLHTYLCIHIEYLLKLWFSITWCLKSLHTCILRTRIYDIYLNVATIMSLSINNVTSRTLTSLSSLPESIRPSTEYILIS